ncbi:uncharacterized protein LOC125681142 isoform X2 [Ostrea edulis]|uniref:uncharacterized protein LOC125681142 isoform X2 n=1 Tax=Ostrea edulis TaxID=37623 RepID=UPI0024AEBE29|nr:uncharacterized protein LOC125681142 isoform X2 [Ostrea edulis]XP_048777045.2 uncharacterized protein LOC125681142 isoform X2 [Ostrea edulis]
MGPRFSYHTRSPRAPGNDVTKHRYIDEILDRDDDTEFEDSVVEEQTEIEDLSSIDVRDYVDQFPFENIVFEGGGGKGVAYPGALLALEELGLMAKIKRFAGTSVGSITAFLVALGYSSEEIGEVMETDFRTLFDATLGRLSLLPNLFRYFGWQPMNTLYELAGKLVEKKLGNKDATFIDLYNKTGKELCIVVTNVNNMEEEYFHPKTTPDTPIRIAVRMSASLPGMMQPVGYTTCGQESIYVDGGMLANYPITCFDGWWLSMKKEDSLFRRLQNLNNLHHIMDKRHRFARDKDTADKTLGFVLYSEDEVQNFQQILECRRMTPLVYPDTELGRRAKNKKKSEVKLGKEYLQVKRTVNKFLELAVKYDKDSDQRISREELSGILNDKYFTETDKKRLFGKNVTVEDVMNRLDRDGNGMINFQEIVAMMEDSGFTIGTRCLGLKRQSVTTLTTLLKTLYNTMNVNISQIGFSSQDLSRTVGINTHYIGTLTFGVTKEDVDFLNQESYRSTMDFLRHFAASKLKSKDEKN